MRGDLGRTTEGNRKFQATYLKSSPPRLRVYIMNKKELIKEINNIARKHLILAHNIYTLDLVDCQHISWSITGGMFGEVRLDCPNCGLKIDNREFIDFVEKIGNNDREAIRNVIKRIEILLEDNLLYILRNENQKLMLRRLQSFRLS